jgi:carboxylesterase type B
MTRVSIQFPQQRDWRPLDHEIADAYSSYWANFITTGNPNGGSLPYWPNASQAVPAFLEIGDKVVLRNNFYAGTKMAARDDFMREYAITQYGFQKFFEKKSQQVAQR